MASEDFPWLHSLVTPPLMTTSATRLAQEDIDTRGVQRGVAVIERALAGEGPLTRHELRDRLRSAGLRTEGDWLPAPPTFTRERALAELARRYLAGHGPATGRDLARWAGLSAPVQPPAAAGAPATPARASPARSSRSRSSCSSSGGASKPAISGSSSSDLSPNSFMNSGVVR